MRPNPRGSLDINDCLFAHKIFYMTNKHTEQAKLKMHNP
uniref:Uncharacterized protein n=1 Tax=Rhizophora mucronata TaxID=61149 RepID=A0A2P2PL09_RHIMU